jgi:hypothetical protein
MNNEYRETRSDQRLNVTWESAVITYATKVARYGALCGASLSTLFVLVILWPLAGPELAQAIGIILTGGGLFAGLFGGLAIVIKDKSFPYIKDGQIVRELPAAAAPASLRAWKLERSDGPNQWRYGKQSLSPAQWLALAQAIIVAGENLISQRKLAEWGVITSKESSEGKQLKADLLFLGYAIPAGNDTIRVTPPLRQYLAGKFPALSPYPQPVFSVSNGVADSHHHQTPPNGSHER